MAKTVQQLLVQVSQSLCKVSETPSLDAQVLLSHYLEKPRSWVLAHPEAFLNDQQSTEIDQALTQLQRGVPLPYIISHWEFYGLDFQLTPDVLIPRPETELMVERALDWFRQHPTSCQVIDVGTGCGCVGISLAMHCPHIKVLLTDISLPALQVARSNGVKHGLSQRLEYQQADLLQGITARFDLLCANLPYIPGDMLENLPVAAREPRIALDGGQGGLELISRFLDQARDRITSGGMIILEIDPSQTREVLHQAHDLFPASKTQVFRDLAGHDRCMEISPSQLIAHLCLPEEWLKAQELGFFTDQSLTYEGFIHGSRPDQLLRVANRYYHDQHELKVLWIDPEKVTSEIRWETIDEAFFPHIYGPIDLGAITATTDLQPDHAGHYRQITPPN